MIPNLGIPAHDYPALEGSESGTLVILGGAACVWKDLNNARLHTTASWDADIMTVSDITMHFPGVIRHAYSNSHDQILRHIHNRRDTLIQQYGEVGYAHSLQVWPWPGHGSSGLGACLTGLGLGYDRIILCGIPLDGQPHYFDPPWATSQLDKENLQIWERMRDEVFEGKVTSMSGRTRDILG